MASSGDMSARGSTRCWRRACSSASCASGAALARALEVPLVVGDDEDGEDVKGKRSACVFLEKG